MEEFLRLYTPYRGFARTASKEVHLHGQTIRPGEPITLHYTSANRDPEVFENPDEFMLNRPNITAHMGFGRGRHRCAGMPLARLYVNSPASNANELWLVVANILQGYRNGYASYSSQHHGF